MTREQCRKLRIGDVVFVTKGCPDGDPWQATIQQTVAGGIGAYVEGGNSIVLEDLHMTTAGALARFEQLRAAAIARIEKQIRTLPDRLGKLKARKPVIKE